MSVANVDWSTVINLYARFAMASISVGMGFRAEKIILGD
jgi:hypothetical protein